MEDRVSDQVPVRSQDGVPPAAWEKVLAGEGANTRSVIQQLDVHVARVSIESAGRALHGLREAKVIYTGRRELVVRDLVELRRRSSQRPDDPTLGRLLASIG